MTIFSLDALKIQNSIHFNEAYLLKRFKNKESFFEIRKYILACLLINVVTQIWRSFEPTLYNTPMPQGLCTCVTKISNSFPSFAWHYLCHGRFSFVFEVLIVLNPKGTYLNDSTCQFYYEVKTCVRPYKKNGVDTYEWSLVWYSNNDLKFRQ